MPAVSEEVAALRESVAQLVEGARRDGIEPDRINANEGAESTLSFLLSLAELTLAQTALPFDKRQPWAI